MSGDDVVLAAFVACAVGGGALWAAILRRHAAEPRRSGTPVALANASLFLALAGALLAGAEIYYRFVYDRTDAFGLMKTTEAWFQRHRRLNASGFRDDIEYTLAPPPGRGRVTVVGDSFTEGHGVEVGDRFVNLLRGLLPAGVEVHAVARNGWDTGAELTTVAGLIGDGYRTGEVLLVYCLNDIADLLPEWHELMKPVYAEIENEGFLLRHSYALNHFYYRLAPRRHPVLREYYGAVDAAYEGAPWRTQADRLAGFAAWLAARGIRLRVVTFPFLQDLGPAYRYRDVHRQLGEFWRALGVPHLDLLPVLERHGDDAVRLSRRDPHPNAAGHRIAAHAIASFLLGGT